MEANRGRTEIFSMDHNHNATVVENLGSTPY